jgi:nucleotide-binding universal stress UspA family protein
MSAILGCLDRSGYAASVCDHAAWLSGADAGSLDLVHVREGTGGSDAGLLQDAVGRLIESGVRPGAARIVDGPPETALLQQGAEAGVVVVGKRGEGSAADRRRLGSNAARLVRHLPQPLCLVSQVFFPIHRGLLLIDADVGHRRTIDFVVGHPILAALQLDAVVMAPDGRDPAPKLALARAALGAGADVFATAAADPDEASAAYMRDHQVDLIVLSREMLFAQARAPADQMEERALWASRTPLFVC